MRFTLALTPRLMAISAVSGIAIVVLLVMLGFELGLREARSEFAAHVQPRTGARVDMQADAANQGNGPVKSTAGLSPAATVQDRVTDSGKDD